MPLESPAGRSPATPSIMMSDPHCSGAGKKRPTDWIAEALGVTRHPGLFLALVLAACHAGAAGPVSVGVARIDITPEMPIRLSGYASRAQAAEQVETRLFARAIAISSEHEPPVVLVSAETARISAELSAAVAAGLQASDRLERARVAVCATHIHTGPVTAQSICSAAVPGEGTGPVDAGVVRYTQVLQAKLLEVARAALDARAPARLAWGVGAVGFATNRRKIVDGKWTEFGPVSTGLADRSLPVLRVQDEQARVRAVLIGYACHSTTLMAKHNFIHSDWPGDACAKLEAEFPDSVALVLIGCAGDTDPYPRGSLEAVTQHGSAVAAEVKRLIGLPLQGLGGVTEARYTEIGLPFSRQMTRADFLARVATGDRAAQANASRWIEHLDAGNPVPANIACPVQVWSFGSDLALVLLGGEVASAYSLRLKCELDRTRLWVAAYVNSMPTYLPSRRMFDEGGYEVDQVTNAIGLPDRLARDTEDRVVEAVRTIVPAAYR